MFMEQFKTNEEHIEEEIRSFYGIHHLSDIDMYLFFYLRYALSNPKNRESLTLTEEDLAEYISSEMMDWNLLSPTRELLVSIFYICKYTKKEIQEQVKTLYSKINNRALQNAAKYKSNKQVYDIKLKQEKINLLKKEFNVPKITPMEKDWSNLLYKYEKKNNNFFHIKEEDVEKYLMNHLDLLEEGLTLLGRQFILPEGRIDLLAKDVYGKICVIELKIEEDKDLLWQSLYYKEEMERRYGKDNVRIIAVSPDYSKSLEKYLREISDAELFTYMPSVINGEITNLFLTKLA